MGGAEEVLPATQRQSCVTLSHATLHGIETEIEIEIEIGRTSQMASERCLDQAEWRK